MKEEILKLRDEVNAGTPEGEPELLDIIRRGLADVMVDARNAIHAYIEKVTREAREDERRTVAAEAMRIVRRMEAQRGAGLEEQSVAATEAPAPDAELKRLILAYASAVHSHPHDSFVIAKGQKAIVTHVEKVKREAHDIGFRRGLRELPPDLRRPPEDDELPRVVDMMAATEAPNTHPNYQGD